MAWFSRRFVFRLTVLGIMLAVAMLASPLKAGDWAGSFASIKAAASKVKIVQARFVQQKHLKILARPILSHGRFVFQAPDSIRWEYTDPIKSEMIMNRGDLARYTFHKGKWVKDASARVEALRVVIDEIQSWLTGSFEDSKAFSARLDPDRKRTVIMEPRQKAMAEIIQRIVLTLDDRPGSIKRVEIIEGPDASTIMDFQNVQINEPMEKGSFAPPK